jgi:hypothetical protein
MLFAPIRGVPSPSTTFSYITFKWLTKASSFEISVHIYHDKTCALVVGDTVQSTSKNPKAEYD